MPNTIRNLVTGNPFQGNVTNATYEKMRLEAKIKAFRRNKRRKALKALLYTILGVTLATLFAL